jgi:FO synthase
MHAVARVMLDGVIHNVQVSWVKLGIEASCVILQGGANDFGGTLMEETISRMAGAAWGIRMEPHEFDHAILTIGRTPVQRTTTYEPLHPNGVREPLDAHTMTTLASARD